MLGLQNYIRNNEEIRAVVDGIDSSLREQLLSGLSGSARTVVMATLYRETKRSQLVVTHNLYQAQKLYEDLVELMSEEEVLLYPVNELISAEIAIASPEMKAQRIDVLNKLISGFKGIVIVPLAGMRRLLPPASYWRLSQLHLKRADDIGEIHTLLEKLIAIGFERVDMVSSPGEVSVRGGIVDIYPLTESDPIRLELFDTEIDSIRTFSIDDQRSKEELAEITIGPAEEILLYKDDYERASIALTELMQASIKKVRKTETKEKISRHISYEIGQLKQQTPFQGMYKYMAIYYDAIHSIISYMEEDTVVFVDEMSRVKEMAESLQKEEAGWSTALLEQGEIVHGVTLSVDAIEELRKSTFPLNYLSLFIKHVPSTSPQNIVNFNCKSMQHFHGQMQLLESELKRWQVAGYAIVFMAGTKERVNRLSLNLEEEGIDVRVVEQKTELTNGMVHVMTGTLHSGFELPLQKLIVITEEEVFTKQTKRAPRKQKISNAERIKSYSELKVGDLIVHTNHGIGKYLGVETLEFNGLHKDYLHLRYAGNDKLYVPVEQIDQVQKYVGSEEKEPKIYALGGSDWKKVKKKVQSSVEDIADDLIKLYAEREASKGYAFSKDGPEQAEFEASFQYQETEDQLRAIEEIKEDMEKERPMDRLLCGDVGYGKTEVAIRAAFKAINDGKQVAILVPTTILAQQHYETIKERFSEYAINIGVLSRFRSRKEQTTTLKGLKAGSIDLVVGTHRLLSKDVVFKDLGLLIVDEEQRFGVTHKEKIKTLKANIDVLTLTATPIPRTLHMSMLGVRDLSVIETPPENRFPVQTYVVENNAALIREAIERELTRGGQIYFLYNRVEDIERMTEQISNLVPDAKVSYAHGQMNERELEGVILDFLEGNSDVLVTTTIIETGVDIPNVNTLIIHDADKMGLSQLYQIRGRVGRSNRVAYAYFTYQRDKVLSEVAEKRLQAIKEFTELGSGFKIAMRDLTIRGAGNLLGSQQHGFIESVGFDLYSQMLKEAIEERKGDKPKEKPFRVELDVKIDAYIPESYIKDAKQKIEMYKRVKGIEEIKELQDLQDEMIDRFGEYPKNVEYLLRLTKIMLLSNELKIEQIVESKDSIQVLLTEESSSMVDGAKLFEIVNKLGREVSLGTAGQKIKFAIKTKTLNDDQIVDYLEQIVVGIQKARKRKVQQSS
ncbi:transcription-repair coupling factor [Alkalihalobacillus alcalophilus ATCC 27647 = CGMCC 1.3604]|uniref:Transcription-repair-coupling factor n=1 Tax=Alkalihalobacillus alcalophilus ATCC 27647 = CGMCC 1.3604 TaxID=1218173 RepID=A0A094XB90_ALKAL|nr:transcription-repair coupling factor [Alkalihalobacillus alcalophilus]KGA96070.1 transcription-repair coupling factor [Alkalihalobacillus alcalophilus ATCC 27647 = CGMCC 1.3604]MED1562404.1 transcription-repair coupling factor [Alkalihalobacillus alcalophilus]THG90070.1 transcription-repair coupling factor [Alkalihalobacillus alcalophilus ATCC 27647 = CGMCC 1.3604]